MAKRDEVLKSFLENPMTSELCNLSTEELSQVTFSSYVNDPLIEALKRMIISSIDKEEAKLTTIKAVNTVLNSKF